MVSLYAIIYFLKMKRQEADCTESDGSSETWTEKQSHANKSPHISRNGNAGSNEFRKKNPAATTKSATPASGKSRNPNYAINHSKILYCNSLSLYSHLPRQLKRYRYPTWKPNNKSRHLFRINHHLL